MGGGLGILSSIPVIPGTRYARARRGPRIAVRIFGDSEEKSPRRITSPPYPTPFINANSRFASHSPLSFTFYGINAARLLFFHIIYTGFGTSMIKLRVL